MPQELGGYLLSLGAVLALCVPAIRQSVGWFILLIVLMLAAGVSFGTLSQTLVN